jgi:hypothetical protein
MAINPDFDYDKILALTQAKLVERTRLNSLGSYEITINYNQINSGTKEDCLEWLEANRLSITDPTVSFKTYEGTWNCTTIAYNEDRNIIQQKFKIDSQVGDLGDIGDEPDYSLQAGDLSRISAGMNVQKAYYWRVVSPDGIELPPSPGIEGEIWTKTSNDNGDGTYDVTVQREEAQNLEATGEVQYGGSNVFSTSIIVSGAGIPAVNGSYVLTGTFDGKDYWTQGIYFLYWNTLVAPDSWVIGTGLVSGSTYYTAAGDTSSPPATGWITTISGTVPAPITGSGATTGGPYNQTTDVDTNDDEKVFGVNVTDATDGQIITVSNTPLENGRFRTEVTTRDAKPMRVPAQEGTFFEYSSDGWAFPSKSFITGRNRSFAEFTVDANLLSSNIYYLNRINNISMRVNDFGLYDYTITSNEPG